MILIVQTMVKPSTVVSHLLKWHTQGERTTFNICSVHSLIGFHQTTTLNKVRLQSTVIVVDPGSCSMDSTRAGTLDCSSVSIVETIGQVHIAGVRLKLAEAAIKKIFQLRKKKNTGCAIILVELMTVQDVQCARSWGEGAIFRGTININI